MRKIFAVDRIEGDLAVCISDDEEIIELPVEVLSGMRERDVFSAEIGAEGTLSDILPMPEERDRRLKAARERLERLKNRK